MKRMGLMVMIVHNWRADIVCEFDLAAYTNISPYGREAWERGFG